jgi:hypothetical protein
VKFVRSIAFVGMLPVLLSACYTYMPAQIETVPAGQEVRATLTRQGRIDLPESFELDDPFVSGKVVRRESDQLFLSIPVARQQQGFHVSQITQEVGIRTGDIADLQVRKLDGVKTGLFVLGSAAAAVGVVYAIIEASSRSNQNGSPPLEEFRIPLISIPIR